MHYWECTDCLYKISATVLRNYKNALLEIYQHACSNTPQLIDRISLIEDLGIFSKIFHTQLFYLVNHLL